MKRSHGTTRPTGPDPFNKLRRFLGVNAKDEDPRAHKYKRNVIPIGNAGGTYRKGD